MALSIEHGEAEIVQAYFDAAPRSGLIVDVGAQFGTSFRKYLAQGWRVIAFEPDPVKLPKLEKYRQNLLLTLFTDAVSDRPVESAPFFTSEESTGISTLAPFRPSHQLATHVRVTTLTRVLDDLRIDHIDFLKIDTEGLDYRVLCGMPFDRITPEVVLCEFDELKTRQSGWDFRTVGDLLLGHGYDVFLSEWQPIVRYGGGYAWRRVSKYPCDLLHADAWGNFIAVRTDASAGRMAELLRPHLS